MPPFARLFAVHKTEDFMKVFKIPLVILAIAIGVLAGVAIGVLGHRSIGRWLGMKGGSAEAPAGQKPAATAGGVAKRKILYWWDPMVGPASISNKPGISSMGMKLIPVYAPASGAATPGEVTVDPAMVQDMGIQTARVSLGPLRKTIRTVGTLRRAAPARYAVTLRVSGWIGKLYATTNGIAVKKGDKLFTLYSPQLLAAQQELVAAEKLLRAGGSDTPVSAGIAAHALITSIANRLRYLGVSGRQIATLERTLKPREYITFYSPAAGFLEKIKIRQKSRVMLGTRVMQIVNLNRVWLDSQVYENQLPWVELGQTMSATLASQPGRKFSGKIIFISPTESSVTHTVRVRAVFENRRGLLKPGMYALVDIVAQPVAHAILAPLNSIINTGTGQLAFVEVSHGHFDPATVTTGLEGDHNLIEVLSGLRPNQRVVVNGQFLIDVESNLNQLAAHFMPSTRAAGKPGARKSAHQRRKPQPPATASATPPAGAKPAMPKGMKMQ